MQFSLQCVKYCWMFYKYYFPQTYIHITKFNIYRNIGTFADIFKILLHF